MDQESENLEVLKFDSVGDMSERIKKIEALVLVVKLLKGLARNEASVKMAESLIDKAEFVLARAKHNPVS